jgi:hypothetical protein
MRTAKLATGATIAAASTADGSHIAVEMSGGDLVDVRVLLKLSEAKALFWLIDLAVADLESAKGVQSHTDRNASRNSNE